MFLLSRAGLVIALIVIAFAQGAGLRAQDTVYTHWPAVRQSAFDPVKKDNLFRQTEVLLAKPVSEKPGRTRAPADGDTPGWTALEEARRRMGQGDFTSASKSAEQALNAARNLGDRRLEMQSLNSIGSISREVFLGASLKAVPYHEEALQIAQELRDSACMISQLISLADNYGQAGRNDLFLEYIGQAVSLLNRFDIPASRMGLGVMFGCFLETQGEPARSEKIFQAALGIALKTGNLNYAQHIYWQLFWLHLGASDASKAETALNLARHTGSGMAETEFYEAYYQLEKLRGNRAEAFRYLEKSYKSLGEQYARRSAEQLAGWETRLRTREKELQLEAQQHLLDAQQKGRWYLYGLVALVSLLFLGSLIAWHIQRQAKRALHRQNQIIEQQTTELKQLDQLKSRFFANVSHELRTPLTLILGPLSQALREENITAKHAAMLKMAQRNSQHLLDLVNEILELSKLKAAGAGPQEQPTVLYDFLNEIVGAFQSCAQIRKIEFSLDYLPEKLWTLSLDRQKLLKIVNNLLSNALKFAPGESTVLVRVEKHGPEAHIQVHDAGPGIHPEDLPHIFDLYFQSKRPEAKAEGGTGIGLTLSGELARLMGGRLWAESVYGAGSTFYLAVPAKVSLPETAVPVDPSPGYTGAFDPPAQQPAFQTLPAVPEYTTRLLVVEDNPDLQEFLRATLPPDYHLTVTGNGRAALDYLSTAEQLPDLILSDVMMPLLDGFQLLEIMRGNEQWRNIPVILLTALTGHDDRIRAFRIGIDDYITKPFSPEELQVRIENALRNLAARREWTETATDDAETTGSTDAWVQKLRETARENLGNPQFNVDDLADRMGVGRKTLYRLVRERTGLSANQLIQELRLLQAREMLETGQVRTLRQVAEAVGLRSPDYLSRLYRARFGKPPSEDQQAG